VGQILKIVAVVVGIIVIFLVLTVGYYGLVPGISTIMRADKPRDLGISYTEQDRLNGRAKINWQLEELPSSLPPEQSLIYSGQKDVTASFSSQELTAWLDNNWKYTPITNAQIKISQDNTIEMSGILHTDRIETYARVMHAPEDFYSTLMNYHWLFIGKPPIYIKVSATITHNIAQAKIYKFQIGRFSISPDLLSQNNNIFTEAAEWQIKSIPGLNIRSLSFKNGFTEFDGTLPAVISRVIE